MEEDYQLINLLAVIFILISLLVMFIFLYMYNIISALVFGLACCILGSFVIAGVSMIPDTK